MSRSHRLTQSLRLSATKTQSMLWMVAFVGMPAGGGTDLLVGSAYVGAVQPSVLYAAAQAGH